MGFFSVIKKVFSKKRRDPMIEVLESLNLSIDDLYLMQNIKKALQVKVTDIMTPRADIEWIDGGASKAILKSALAKSRHSYVIVAKTSLDKVVGKIPVKTTLMQLMDNKVFSLEKIITPVLYVSPSLTILDLIIKMKKDKKFLALVVDEFGGVDGLIAPHDIICDVIGEIDVEKDKISSPMPGKNHTITIDGRYSLEEFQEKYGYILTKQDKENDLETLAGLIISLAGRVPKKGEIFTHASGVRFEILECTPRKVIKVKVHNLHKMEKHNLPVGGIKNSLKR